MKIWTKVLIGFGALAFVAALSHIQRPAHREAADEVGRQRLAAYQPAQTPTKAEQLGISEDELQEKRRASARSVLNFYEVLAGSRGLPSYTQVSVSGGDLVTNLRIVTREEAAEEVCRDWKYAAPPFDQKYFNGIVFDNAIEKFRVSFPIDCEREYWNKGSSSTAQNAAAATAR